MGCTGVEAVSVVCQLVVQDRLGILPFVPSPQVLVAVAVATV